MRHGSLFSGVGGFDLAAEWMGWENVFSCEINPFGRKVLEYYWPNAKHYEDITKTDFSKYRGTVDIITGGFPCQPFSQAGNRKGATDDRYLWPEMLRVIEQVRPTWVVGENVAGIFSMVQPDPVSRVGGGASLFGEEKDYEEVYEYVTETVRKDFERIGYSLQIFDIPACAVGAPHKRHRVWFVAHRDNRNRQEDGLQARREINVDGIERAGATPDNSNTRVEGVQREREDGVYKLRATSNTPSMGREPGTVIGGEVSKEIRRSESNIGNKSQITSNPGNQGLQGNERYREDEEQDRKRGTGASGAVGKLYRSTNFEQFPTQSPVCQRDDGISSRLDGITFPKWRNESIKAAGNAIVPQVVYEIFKVIQLIETKKYPK